MDGALGLAANADATAAEGESLMMFDEIKEMLIASGNVMAPDEVRKARAILGCDVIGTAECFVNKDGVVDLYGGTLYLDGMPREKTLSDTSPASGKVQVHI